MARNVFEGNDLIEPEHPGVVAIRSVLEVLQEHGMTHEQARNAVFDMQRKGVVMTVSNNMVEIADQHDIVTDLRGD